MMSIHNLAAEDIIAMGAADLVARLKSGELSAVEVVDAHIARIKRTDATLNAVVVRRFEEAHAEAVEADAARAAGRSDRCMVCRSPSKNSFCSLAPQRRSDLNGEKIIEPIIRDHSSPHFVPRELSFLGKQTSVRIWPTLKPTIRCTGLLIILGT